MKTKKIKAAKIWHYGTRFNAIKRHADNCASMRGEKVSPVYAIPAAADSVERMVEQMAMSMSGSAVPWDHIGHGAQQVRINMIRAALAAIGITSRAPKSALPNV